MANKITNWANYTAVCSNPPALAAQGEQAAVGRQATVSEPFAQSSQRASSCPCVRKARNRRTGQLVPPGCNLQRIFIICEL